MIWVYGAGISVVFLNASPDDGSRFGDRAGDVVGLIMWIIGFLCEAVSDQQKFNHRFHDMPKFREQNPGKTAPVLKRGLWRWSRQPNYFGEIFLWWGMFVMCLPANPSVSNGLPYVTLISPLLTTVLLLFLSGIPLAEQGYQKRYLSVDNKDAESKADYLQYRRETSPLIPMPNSLYHRMPLWAKRVFLFEFKMYETTYLAEAETSITLPITVTTEDKAASPTDAQK